jgi:AcrR family transcriptional regulator
MKQMKNYDWKIQFFGGDAAKLTEKHRRILLSAVEVFSEKGYAGTTTREIASRAEVTEAAIFKYYSGKEALFTRVTQMIESSIISPLLGFGLDDIAKRSFPTVEALFRAILVNRIKLVSQNIVPVRVMIQELPFRSELRERFAAIAKNLAIAKTLKKALKKNFGITKNVSQLLGFLVNCVFGYIFMRCVICPEMFSNANRETANFAKFLAKKLEA